MFNWDEFKNRKVAVNCDTEEKAREFIKECFERGMKWSNFTESKTMFDWYKRDTCYEYKIYENRLMYSDEKYYKNNGYKIIKWESEKMKFKVGDKVRAIDNRYGFTRKDLEFIGLVTNVYEYVIEDDIHVETISSLEKNEIGKEYDVNSKHFELIERQTEFTFQEVIARIKEGEVYVNTNPSSRVEKLSLKYGKEVLIIEGNYKGLMHNEFGIILEDKFKLQKPKKIATIYRVEHKKDGKKYDFISSQRLEKEMFVVCDTSQGKSYGRIVDIYTKELTEKEIKQYKECWRA